MVKKLSLEVLESRDTPSTVGFDGAGNLLITGTDNRDMVWVYAYDKRAVTVTLDRVPVPGSFAVTAPGARVIVDVKGDDDGVWVAGSQLAVEEHGGAGNDALYAIMGGYGPGAVLFGDDGDDVLTSGAAADVLVGGLGRDWLRAGSGDDVLITGKVDTVSLGFSLSKTIGGGGGFTNDSSGFVEMRAVSADWRLYHSEFSPTVNALVEATADPIGQEEEYVNGEGQKDLYIHAVDDEIYGFLWSEGDRERIVGGSYLR